MSKLFAGTGCALLFATLLMASNESTRVWSQPAPPSREALDRLNLQQDWAVYVPMDGRLDGFASIQVVGNELIVQTRSGMVDAIHRLRGLDHVAIVQLTEHDIVRHPLVTQIVKAYEETEKGKTRK